ncbi:MAG: helicase-related protein [Bacteroidia bacterium]|nr:helicase-related protein [Bacteroidia bacterium]
MIENFDAAGLLTPQIEHAKQLCESLISNNIAWDASGTGQGKTFVASAIVRHLKRKFVVICPKLNIPKWKIVAKLFGVTPEFVINYEKLARGNLKQWYKYKTDYQKGVPHFLRGEFCFPKDWIVICDESHRTKGIDSLSSGLLFALKNQGYSILCLSATQAMTPLDLRAFGYATNLHKGMSVIEGENFGMRKFKEFAESAGAEYKGKWGAMYFDSDKPDAVKKLQSIHSNLFDTQKIASRMKREDFGDIFPKNQIECTAYDMGENGRKINHVYNEMVVELAKLEERCENYANCILAIIVRARRMAELFKVPSLCEMTEDLYAENKSVILFVNYQDTIDSLVSRLSNTFGKELIGQIHGKQTINQRLQDIADFQADKKRITIANLAAGGESIDLNDVTGKYPRASLINPSYRAIAVIQSCGRHDRANTKSDCLTRLVLADGTIETSVADNFNSKKGHLDILQDGDFVPNGLKFRGVAGMNV